MGYSVGVHVDTKQLRVSLLWSVGLLLRLGCNTHKQLRVSLLWSVGLLLRLGCNTHKPLRVSLLWSVRLLLRLGCNTHKHRSCEIWSLRHHVNDILALLGCYICTKIVSFLVFMLQIQSAFMAINLCNHNHFMFITTAISCL